MKYQKAGEETYPPKAILLIEKVEHYKKEISMTRRYTGHMNGERYLSNTSPSKREVHDLDNEKVACQIDEIIRAGHDKPYHSRETANNSVNHGTQLQRD